MDSRVLDANARWLGISTLQLMENAGKAVADECSKFDSLVVFAGTGNNGGDGLVAARHLLCIGKKVKVYSLVGNRSEACQTNLNALFNSGVKVDYIRDSSDIQGLKINQFDCVIDALIGVGVKGKLREPVKSIVELINKCKAKKICVDVPSGDNELKVKSDLTVAFHNAKTVDAKVVDIGIPREAELYCGPGDVCNAIPVREENAHKGKYGKLLVVGGSNRYTGAPYLTAWSAMRAGVDLCFLYTPKKVAERIQYNPNLIIQPLKSKNYLTEDDVDRILKQEYDAMVIGNGLGTNSETLEAVKEILKRNKKPIVVDADALKAVKASRVKANMILTPHVGEYKRLDEEYSEETRLKNVKEYAKKTKGIVVLKGKIDVISDGLTTRLNNTGNPGMTVGGTGDVLAGIIGGLLAQNKLPYESACAGAFLTGLAGDHAYKELDVSLTATDVIEELPYAIKKCREYM